MLVYAPDCARHVNAPGHVESPERVAAIAAKIESLGMLQDYIVPEPATLAQVGAIHQKSYVDLLEGIGDGYLDTDTAVHPDTLGLARLAAGGAVGAALAAAEAGRPAFALVRPPGHHAGPDYGGGFCYLNNVAIAARVLLERLPRVAILDFDAHHGNGTQDAFAGSREVLYVSTHQGGIYPGTGPAEYVGEGRGEGYTVNLPFPARSGDAAFELAMSEVVAPILRQFLPEAILVSYGGDAHYKDPLTALALTSPGYLGLAEQTVALAKSICDGRVAFVLEGGYHLPALAEVMAATYGLFRGESVHLQFREQRERGDRGKSVVARAKAIHGERWHL